MIQAEVIFRHLPTTPKEVLMQLTVSLREKRREHENIYIMRGLNSGSASSRRSDGNTVPGSDGGDSRLAGYQLARRLGRERVSDRRGNCVHKKTEASGHTV